MIFLLKVIVMFLIERMMLLFFVLFVIVVLEFDCCVEYGEEFVYENDDENGVYDGRCYMFVE